MKITGSHTIAAPRDDVWSALLDPAVLARTLPGCQQLEVLADDRYAATVHAGVGAIKGSYTGEVELTEKQQPERYVMKATGAGGPGTIQADAVVTLHDEGEATRVEFEADAVVGGMIAGVGQRMVVGVAQRTAADFFSAVERDLTGPAVPAPEQAAAAPAAPGVPAAAKPAAGQVFAGRATAAPAADANRLLMAALAGAMIALLGVLAGRRIAR